jgi:ABC-type nitrate/sulfonate/bicarbonate transport system substrate-binding protein
MDDVRVGFIPLIDCAVIVAAQEMGFAERHGLRLILSREPSWAAIRDRVAFGVLDVAHMLAPLPVAMTLGLGGQPSVAMRVPLGLGTGGNAITVSTALHRAMAEADPAAMAGPPALTARALAAVAAARRAAGLAPLRLASVYPFSCHQYELRTWLDAGGVAAEDVAMLVIPPARMVENLASGLVDGICVGEPWNTLAEAEGAGRIVATKDDVAPGAPEKVVGVTRAWAEANPGILNRLRLALSDAAEWARNNPERLAALLSDARFIDIPAPALAGSLPRYRPQAAALTSDQKRWMCDQLSRWEQGAPASTLHACVDAVYSWP